MKLSISQNADPNYLAVVVNLPEIKEHPNAERLSLVEIFGNTIVIAKGMYTEGEKVVYFPVESCIKPEFLSWANLFDKPELNEDGKTKGFFNAKGCRVKAVKLREIPSQGFLYKVEKLAEYYKTSEKDFGVGESFDTVGDHLLVTKYVRPEKNTSEPSFKKNKIPKWINNTLGYLPRPIRTVVFKPIKWYYGLSKDDGIKSLIVDGQFKFHYKTEHLGKNLWLLKPEDEITISSKWHGTSAIFGNLLCKRKLNIFESLGKAIGFNIDEHEYKLVYASRSVLKNRRDGKYTEDVWGRNAEIIDGNIPAGFCIYAEIVGYASPGKCIQSMKGKGYDYGCALGDNDLRVYRVTHVDSSGNFTELTWDELSIFCRVYSFTPVESYYNGVAKDLYPDIPIDENWGANFLARLKENHLDKTCEFCTTGVVNEGIVVKINSREGKPVFKFKSPLFVIGESAARDAGEEDTEEES